MLDKILTNIEDRNQPTYWCFRFVEELYEMGVRYVIISPGSRSTPLAFAFDAHTGFHKQVVLDERSAAFVALGIGKAKGVPAALVCTSGTAAANYYPAIIESRQSETPLLVLTADRPPNQRYTGASQTIDQIKLFGDYPIFFHEAGEPKIYKSDLNRLSLLASQAAEVSMESGGPVHINFPFRKPLEPDSHFVKQLRQNADNQIKGNRTQYINTIPSQEISTLPVDIVTLINQARRPLIIAGPRHAYLPGGEKIVDFAEQLNAPLLAEAASQIKGSSRTLIKGYDAFLRNQEVRDTLKPDVIIRTGGEPTSKALELLIRDNTDALHIHLYESGKPQNALLSRTTRTRIDWPAIKFDSLENHGGDYLDSWMEHSKASGNLIGATLKKHHELADPHIYHELVPHIPQNYTIVLSNSFPIRDFDMFGNFSNSNHPVIVNRGAAGIDGVTSTAIGAWLSLGQGTVLFTGDLAFLHDTTALQQTPHIQKNQPLIIIVINNKGGSIFRMLPFDDLNDQFVNLFETPQCVNISKLAQAHGCHYLAVTKRDELISSIQSAITKTGITVLECQTDPDTSMNIRHALWK